MENQQKIVDQAGIVVSRVQLFYERFLNVEATLRKTQDAFESLRKMLLPSGQSIISAANKLVKLGAREDVRRKRQLPKGESEEGAESNVSELPTADPTTATLTHSAPTTDS